MATGDLTILAGIQARQWLADEGLSPGRIQTIAAASGGAKWLVLSALDRAITQALLPDLGDDIFLLGSSIGAWRMTAYAQPDPHTAIQRFEEAYIGQEFHRGVSAAEVTRRSRELAGKLIGPDASAIVGHQRFSLNIVVARSRGLTRFDHPAAQLPGLLLAAGGNALHRTLLRPSFQRVIVGRTDQQSPFRFTPKLADRLVPLSERNLESAILASGSIPLVLEGVRDLDGAPAGVYRDGGITDYHFADRLSDDDRITFMPHFYPHAVPGWFDKPWKRRWKASDRLSHTVIVAPSEEFVARLPYGKIPDRHDFINLTRDERMRYWNTVLLESQSLADAFLDLLNKPSLSDGVKPL